MRTELQSSESNLLLETLQASVLEHKLFGQSSSAADLSTPVVVGVSGGADSVCLLHALHVLTSKLALTLHVAHLDHNLRPTSAAEAASVAGLAQALGLPFHTDRLPPDELRNQPGGLENAARQARYRFLAQIAYRVTPPTHTPIIAVAHHADDQAETVLMNLARGSGLHGLSGMQPLSLLDPAFAPAERPAGQPAIRLVRPLLTVSKCAILDYLRQHQLTWLEDESNQQTIYTRNLLRRQVMPLLRQINPNLTETIGRTAQILGAEAARVDDLDRKQFEDLLLTQKTGCIVLDATQLLTLPQAAQRNIVRMALHNLADDVASSTINMQHVEQLLRSLHTDLHASGPHPLTHNLAWTLAGQSDHSPARLSLHHHDALPFEPNAPHLDAAWRTTTMRQSIALDEPIQIGDWQLSAHNLPRTALPPNWQHGSPWTAYLDAEQIGPLLLTTPQPGMRFAALGLNGHHKNLGDFFTDRKIHPSLRGGWPIIIDGESGAILWVCGLQIAHPPRITNHTQQVLHLYFTL